jgi:CRISPR-associated protein Cas2
MKGIGDYAVVYDISSDKERRQIDKTLKGFGFRVQRSVFECRMSRGGRNELIAKLDKLCIKSGFIKLYKLDYTCKNLIIGAAAKKNPDEGHAFII